MVTYSDGAWNKPVSLDDLLDELHEVVKSLPPPPTFVQSVPTPSGSAYLVHGNTLYVTPADWRWLKSNVAAGGSSLSQLGGVRVMLLPEILQPPAKGWRRVVQLLRDKWRAFMRRMEVR